MKTSHPITEKVKASYVAIADEFSQSRMRPWPEFDAFLSHVESGARVLDVGCGNGRLYDFLKQKQIDYLGLDHNPEFIKKATDIFPEAQFQLQEMTDLDLPKNHFDVIFSIAAFHHLPTKKLRKKVLLDLHRSLKKEGVLILTTWNLFQWRYVTPLIKSVFRSLLTLGLRGGWNDLWIKWGKYPLKRYYHSFLPSELRRLFPPNLWVIEDFYFTKKGKRVKFWGSFNVVIILKKTINDSFI